MNESCAIILNGEFYNKDITESFIICADNGYEICLKKNVIPNVIVGDLDSIINYDKNIKVLKFPKEKDQTDGELALNYAHKKGFKNVNIYGADGGRLDHIMGNISLLYQAHSFGIKAVLKTNLCDVYYSQDDFILDVEIEDIISLVPFSEMVHIMDTEGLKYALHDASLKKGTTIGISNIAVSEKIRYNIDKGEALIFRIFT